MGRPPIGKVAMTNTERSRRYRAGLAAQPAATKFATKPFATKPVTKPSPEPEASKDQEIAKLKARIRELEAELAHARSQREAEVGRLRAAADTPKHHRPESRGAAVKEDTELMKVIRRLDSANNDNEAVGAIRKLASELQARGRGFQQLADLTVQWDQEDAIVRTPKPKPVDWPKVESIVKTYTEGKTKVTYNAVSKAVYAHMPKEQEEKLREHSAGFIIGCLRRLSFVRRSESTYERTARA
jgi:hypothetical protein